MTTQTLTWSQRLQDVNTLCASVAQARHDFRKRVGPSVDADCFDAHARDTGAINKPRREPDPTLYREYCELRAAESESWQLRRKLREALAEAVQQVAKASQPGLEAFIELSWSCECSGFDHHAQAASFLDALGIPT